MVLSTKYHIQMESQMRCRILHNIAVQVLLLIKFHVCVYSLEWSSSWLPTTHIIVLFMYLECHADSLLPPRQVLFTNMSLFFPPTVMISDYYRYSCHLSLFWFRVNTIEPWCHFWTPHNFLHIELLTTYHVTSENRRKFLTNSGLQQPNLFSSTMPAWFH